MVSVCWSTWLTWLVTDTETEAVWPTWTGAPAAAAKRSSPFSTPETRAVRQMNSR